MFTQTKDMGDMFMTDLLIKDTYIFGAEGLDKDCKMTFLTMHNMLYKYVATG